MNFMGNNKELLLVHTSMKQVTLSHAVNIMLTPQFYTLKKEALPVRYTYQAKRIAPSLFDGLLEEGKHYEYMVWREGEEWIFLAYDLEMIAAFLETKVLHWKMSLRSFLHNRQLTLLASPCYWARMKHWYLWTIR